MVFEFMTAAAPLPPCVPLPKTVLRIPVSSTAKVMYARMLDEALANGVADVNGIIFVRFPVKELSAALSRSQQACKRALNELEGAGLIVRVRQGIGKPNKIYVRIPRMEGTVHE